MSFRVSRHNDLPGSGATEPALIYGQELHQLPLTTGGTLAFSACQFDVSRFKDSDFAKWGVVRPTRLAEAVKKRQAEFLAGRVCAMEVMATLRLPVLQVPSGENQLPVWPEGIRASVSHTNSRAICMATCSADTDFVGVDIELWLSRTTMLNVKNMVVNAAEQQLLLSQSDSLELAVTLAFSVKESLYKAVYPYVGYVFGFDAVEVIDCSWRDRYLDLMIKQHLSDSVYVGQIFRCHFILRTSCVVTFMAGRLGQQITDLVGYLPDSFSAGLSDESALFHTGVGGYSYA